MMSEVADKLKAASDKLHGGAGAESRPEPRVSKRTQRKRGGGGGDDDGGGPAAPAASLAAAGGLAASSLSLTLPAADIQQDMKDIYRDWKAAAQRWRSVAAAVLTPARVERGRLYYGSEIFAKGDAVAVFSELTKQEFYGTMHLLAQVRGGAPRGCGCACGRGCACCYAAGVPLLVGSG